MMDRKILFLILVSLCLVKQAKGANCNNGDVVGENDPKSKDNAIDTGTNLGILLDTGDNEYTFSCCGRVDSWEIYAENAGDVYLQVWRNNAGTYTLQGQNQYTVAAGDEQNEIAIPIDPTQEISVRNGDVIGMYSPGSPIVTYKSEGGGSNQNSYTLDYTIGAKTVGDTYTWPAQSQGRDYAVKAILSGGNNPSFTGNLPETVTFSDTTASGTLIKTVAATDADPLDTLVVTMTTTTSSFSFDTNTLQVLSVGNLPSTAATSTTTLNFQVEDDCGNTATGALRVEVTNSPPVITNLPSSADVSEDETAERLLYTLTVTDASPADTVTCTLTTTNPSTTNFLLKTVSGTSNYGIYLKASPTLNYKTVRSYTLSISCSDTKETDTGTFYVYVTTNIPPVFTNLATGATVSIPSTTTTGDVVYTVTSTDTENDQLTYNMTCDQTTCPFQIKNTGNIEATASLVSLTNPWYDLFIYVYDGHTLVGPRSLSVIVSDIRSVPIISNLPLSSPISVPENTPIGTSIYQVVATDDNVNDILTYSATFTPTSSSGYLTIESSTGLVKTASNILNYEALAVTSVTMSVTVSDGVDSDTENLDIAVVNVNEAPQFAQAVYSITGNEGSAGSLVGSPSYGVTDPDAGATLTYSIDCAEFIINSATGAITFSADYDLDTAGVASTQTCNVSVSDGDLSDSASLQISIDNINDNTPSFSQAAYVFYTYPSTGIGTTIGSAVATDADSGVNGVVSYTLDQSSLTSEFFGIQATGDLYIKKSLATFSSGAVVTLPITATDSGGLSSTSTITIIIPEEVTTTPSAVNEEWITFFEDPRNVAWVTVVAVTFVAMAILVIIVGYRTYRCGDFWRSCKERISDAMNENERNRRALRSDFYY